MKVLLLVLSLCVFSFTVNAEEKVKLAELKDFTYVSMEFKGSYSGMGANVERFMSEFFKQGLTPAGPFCGIYFNSPEEVAEPDLVWALGFQVPAGTKVTPPLKLKTFKGGRVVQYLHVGPYEHLDHAFMKVRAFCRKHSFKIIYPTIDKFLNSPQNVKPAALKTLTIVPVKKK